MKASSICRLEMDGCKLDGISASLVWSHLCHPETTCQLDDMVRFGLLISSNWKETIFSLRPAYQLADERLTTRSGMDSYDVAAAFCLVSTQSYFNAQKRSSGLTVPGLSSRMYERCHKLNCAYTHGNCLGWLTLLHVPRKGWSQH